MLVMGGKWGEINGKFQGRFEKWDRLKVGVSGVEKKKKREIKEGNYCSGRRIFESPAELCKSR